MTVSFVVHCYTSTKKLGIPFSFGAIAIATPHQNWFSRRYGRHVWRRHTLSYEVDNCLRMFRRLEVSDGNRW